jgi:hypothetical protein
MVPARLAAPPTFKSEAALGLTSIDSVLLAFCV